MTRRGLGAAATTVALSWCLAVAGCSHPASEPAAQEARPAAAPPSASPSAPAASPHPSGSTPTPGALATPDNRSGPLTRRSLPRPAALGTGWAYAVDPGDAEEGYLGNGTPALARDPREVVLAAVPLGCPRPSDLPVPDHALEVDYRYRGVKVIALRLAFDGHPTAHRFFAARHRALDACRGRTGGPAIGMYVDHVDEPTQGALLSDRTPRSDPWTELAVLDSRSVVLVAAQGRPGSPPLTTAGAGRLARAFRS